MFFESLISHVTLINSKYTRGLLLYGDSNYDSGINKKIIEPTISFLLSSKIFNQPVIYFSVSFFFSFFFNCISNIGDIVHCPRYHYSHGVGNGAGVHVSFVIYSKV